MLLFKNRLIFNHAGRYLEFLELPKDNNSTPTWILLSKRYIIRRKKTLSDEIGVIFPHTSEMQSCADTEWKMGIMGWVWLNVPWRVCDYHGNGEEKLRVVEELGHFQ